MRTQLFVVMTSVLILVSGLAAQQDKQYNKEKKVLKNADIVLMVQNHFEDETLLKLIEVSDTDFDISATALIEMKNQGVSSVVLRAMLQATQNKRGANQTSAATSPSGPPAASMTVSNGTHSIVAVAPASAPPVDKSVSNESAGSVAANNSEITNSQEKTNPPLSSATPTFTSRKLTAVTQNTNGAMNYNQPEMAAFQSQMAALGMGGMFGNLFGGSFSMNYSPEQMPHVFLMDNQIFGDKYEIAPSIAQMAQTKLKSGAPSAGGSALRSLATEGLSFAAMGGGPAGIMAISAFSMASGFMPGMRPGAPSMTYVWGLPGRKSSREVNNRDPIFQLTYGDIPGIDPDAFEPAIVKLFQTKDNYRLVGATRTKLNKRNMMSGSGPENGKWISEERWPFRVYKEERGFYVLRVDQPLEPGEYAVVLRPVKGYKARPSGLGGHAQVFYSVWDFSVPGATPAETTGKRKK
jgi:hypothetical protein